ncbi:MAG: hypothetical protein LBC84_09505 [Prevotellaceae bacterium]|nr:hypothetical protein [Prevotellaceae bacterium]
MTLRRHDYIPSNANQFHAFMFNLIEYINKNKTAWNFPQDRITELLDSGHRPQGQTQRLRGRRHHLGHCRHPA